jgi:ABC-type multidrug transport system fused ATPase/permease subunit
MLFFEQLSLRAVKIFRAGSGSARAIARTLVTKAPILILDEPKNALDLKHEQWVKETLQRLRRNRTIISVTHRLETAVDCDRIFVMQEGDIVEDGTHAALVARRGLYFRMLGYRL